MPKQEPKTKPSTEKEQTPEDSLDESQEEDQEEDEKEKKPKITKEAEKAKLAKPKFSIGDFIAKLSQKTKYFTVVFFLAVFGFSIWIWWSCFYESRPSNKVIQKVNQSQEDFDGMKSKTEATIKILKDKIGRNEEGLDLSSQRELFMKSDGKIETEPVEVNGDLTPEPEPKPELQNEEKTQTIQAPAGESGGGDEEPESVQ